VVTVTIWEARENWSKVLKAVKKAPHIITNFGRPTGVLSSVEGKTLVDLARELKTTTKGGDGLEMVNVTKARLQLSKILDDAQKKAHVIVNFSEPVALLVGVEGKDIVDLVRDLDARRGR
jgi:antitoxin (DNA-binding transcriptional repressor) of toxin-antitoxin stability system